MAMARQVSYFHCPQLLTGLNLILSSYLISSYLILSYQSGYLFLYLIDDYLFLN